MANRWTGAICGVAIAAVLFPATVSAETWNDRNVLRVVNKAVDLYGSQGALETLRGWYNRCELDRGVNWNEHCEVYISAYYYIRGWIDGND